MKNQFCGMTKIFAICTKFFASKTVFSAILTETPITLKFALNVHNLLGYLGEFACKFQQVVTVL